METIRLIWKCNSCDDVVISYSNIQWDMNSCECGKSAVDLEEQYQRVLGDITEISRKQKVNGKWEQIKI